MITASEILLFPYILIDTRQRASYAFLSKVELTKEEARIKNMGFILNKADEKYLPESEWK